MKEIVIAILAFISPTDNFTIQSVSFKTSDLSQLDDAKLKMMR